MYTTIDYREKTYSVQITEEGIRIEGQFTHANPHLLGQYLNGWVSRDEVNDLLRSSVRFLIECQLRGVRPTRAPTPRRKTVGVTNAAADRQNDSPDSAVLVMLRNFAARNGEGYANIDEVMQGTGLTKGGARAALRRLTGRGDVETYYFRAAHINGYRAGRKV